MQFDTFQLCYIESIIDNLLLSEEGEKALIEWQFKEECELGEHTELDEEKLDRIFGGD